MKNKTESGLETGDAGTVPSGSQKFNQELIDSIEEKIEKIQPKMDRGDIPLTFANHTHVSYTTW